VLSLIFWEVITGYQQYLESRNIFLRPWSYPVPGSSRKDIEAYESLIRHRIAPSDAEYTQWVFAKDRFYQDIFQDVQEMENNDDELKFGEALNTC
jgi:hypothetical protein